MSPPSDRFFVPYAAYNVEGPFPPFFRFIRSVYNTPVPENFCSLSVSSLSRPSKNVGSPHLASAISARGV